MKTKAEMRIVRTKNTRLITGIITEHHGAFWILLSAFLVKKEASSLFPPHSDVLLFQLDGAEKNVEAELIKAAPK